jgi:hypothetical protein
MVDTAHGKADFGPLGDAEDFDGLGDIFDACELGRDTASNAGLIVVQFAYDLKRALLTIPTLNGNANRRANRVVRHLTRGADMLRGVQLGFAKVPRVILDEYADEIGMARGKNRKSLDLKKG